MEIINKPDLRVFASEAKSGEIAEFPDVLRGWGITFEQTQGKPPLEWMNDAFKRVDLNNLYLLQQGVAEWQKEIRYPENSVVKKDGKLYLCLVENEDNEPSELSDKWSLMIKKSTTSQAGIVQLTNDLTDREDLAVTPKAVSDIKDGLDVDISALQKLIFDAVPVGVVKAYIGETAPNDKWLLCRGQAFSASNYPDLAQLLPDLKIPDLRGVALRGLDANRGFDPSRQLLSYQEDAMQKITGSLGDQYNGVGFSASGAFKLQDVSPISNYRGIIGSPEQFNLFEFKIGGLGFDSSLTSRSNTQNETVMKNVAVNFIIKAR